MTRKRKTFTPSAAKKPRSKKQNKLQATRLIQISMVLDNYMYKNEPISTKDAVLYIQEIAAYKIHCQQDERSIQVIEKLTRCMQGIIYDNQNKISNINSIYMNNNTDLQSNLSPVYSLPDEDRTQVIEDPVKDRTQVTENPDKHRTLVIEGFDKDGTKVSEDPDKHGTQVTENPDKDRTLVIEGFDKDGTKVSEDPDKHGTQVTENPDKHRTLVIEGFDKDGTKVSEDPDKHGTQVTENPDKDRTLVIEGFDKDGTKVSEDPDKHGTQVTENPDKDRIRVTEDPDKNITQVTEDHNKDRTQVIKNPFMNLTITEIQTIDLCDDNDNNETNRQSHIDINLNAETDRISNFPMRGSKDPLQITTCSQSTMDDFEHRDVNTNIDCTQNIFKNKDKRDYTQAQIDHRQQQNRMAEDVNSKVHKSTNNQFRAPFKVPAIIDNDPKVNDFNLNKRPKVTEEATMNFEHETITDATISKTGPIKNKTRKRKTTTKPKEGDNGNNRRKKRIAKSTNVSSNDTPNKLIVCQKVNQTVRINLGNQKKTVNESKQDKPITTQVIIDKSLLLSYQMNDNVNTKTEADKTNPVPKTIMHPVTDKSMSIYNSNVENDLSWIENIRYVREITAEENDTKLTFDDAFWDDFTMPSNLSEHDFQYH